MEEAAPAEGDILSAVAAAQHWLHPICSAGAPQR